MKSVLLFLASFPALAQTLTPAEPPTDWMGYGVWLLIAVVVVGIIFFVKHHPTTVSSLKTSLENLTHSHAELVATHAETVAAIPKALETMPPAAQLPPWERKS